MTHSKHCPVFSATVNQEKPKNKLVPSAISAIKITVLPENPTACDKKPDHVLPITPPAPLVMSVRPGSCIPQELKR